jgi:signal transduction histidine kinase
MTIEQKIMVFRVLQELINNSLKYAGANNIRIKFSYLENNLLFEFEDDGKGFDLGNMRRGVGLGSIRSRVEYYKGTAKYDSAPGKGMISVIMLPLAGDS